MFNSRPLMFIVFVLSVLVVSACDSKAVDPTQLSECQAHRDSLRLELDDCNTKTAADLSLIAQHLEGLLVESADEKTEQGVEGRDGEIPLPPVEIPPVTIDAVDRLMAEVGQRLSDMVDQQVRLERQLAASERRARERDAATQNQLDELLNATTNLDDQGTEARRLRIELDILRLQREQELNDLRERAAEIGGLILKFDAEQINCRRCGRVNGFRKSLLSMHDSVLGHLKNLDPSAGADE